MKRFFLFVVMLFFLSEATITPVTHKYAWDKDTMVIDSGSARVIKAGRFIGIVDSSNRSAFLAGYSGSFYLNHDSTGHGALNTAIAGKEPVIASSTADKFWNGLKQWVSVSWSYIIGKPTTISGYGITDAYTKSVVNDSLSHKADTSKVYSKGKVDTLLGGKEPTITGSTVNTFYNGVKQFVNIVASNISDFVFTVRTSLSSTGAITYNNSTGVIGHQTGDGYHHVPATGTQSNGMYLRAGSTVGSEAWYTIPISDVSGLQTALNGKASTTHASTHVAGGSNQLFDQNLNKVDTAVFSALKLYAKVPAFRLGSDHGYIYGTINQNGNFPFDGGIYNNYVIQARNSTTSSHKGIVFVVNSEPSDSPTVAGAFITTSPSTTPFTRIANPTPVLFMPVCNNSTDQGRITINHNGSGYFALGTNVSGYGWLGTCSNANGSGTINKFINMDGTNIQLMGYNAWHKGNLPLPANASGYLKNNGSGTFTYATPTYTDIDAMPHLQNDITVAAAGWYKVARFPGSLHRGWLDIDIFTTGGSYSPTRLNMKIHNTNSVTDVEYFSSENGSSTYWDQARITYDASGTTDKFLEVHFKQALTASLLSIVNNTWEGYGIVPYTGALPSDDNTTNTIMHTYALYVGASTSYGAAYFNDNAVWHKGNLPLVTSSYVPVSDGTKYIKSIISADASTANVAGNFTIGSGTSANPTNTMYLPGYNSAADQGRIIINHSASGYFTIGTNSNGYGWIGTCNSSTGTGTINKILNFDGSCIYFVGQGLSGQYFSVSNMGALQCASVNANSVTGTNGYFGSLSWGNGKIDVPSTLHITQAYGYICGDGTNNNGLMLKSNPDNLNSYVNIAENGIFIRPPTGYQAEITGGLYLNCTTTAHGTIQYEAGPVLLPDASTISVSSASDYNLTVTKARYNVGATQQGCTYNIVLANSGTDGQEVVLTRTTGTGPVCCNIKCGNSTLPIYTSIEAGHAKRFIYNTSLYGGAGWTVED